MQSLDRRDFVALAALAATGSAVPLTFFSAEEAKWVEALMACIIPTDDAPGAKEAGCLYYLDHQLQGALSRFGGAYRDGLATFRKGHPDFLSLGAKEQVVRLEALGRNAFFEMLIDHTMQGYYGSPEHGGNRDEVSWKMLKIERYMGAGEWGQEGKHGHGA